MYGKIAANFTAESKETTKTQPVSPPPIVVDSLEDGNSRRALVEKMAGILQEKSAPMLVGKLDRIPEIGEIEGESSLDEVFEMITPVWMRWTIRLAADTLLSTFLPEQRKLAERALALEVSCADFEISISPNTNRITLYMRFFF